LGANAAIRLRSPLAEEEDTDQCVLQFDWFFACRASPSGILETRVSCSRTWLDSHASGIRAVVLVSLDLASELVEFWFRG
jgi:hypothetical protein